MTCIVGMIDGDDVLIGADSCGGDVKQYVALHRSDSKVFRRGPFLMGFTSSFRMGQLLRYNLQVPNHPKGMGTHRYMSTCFIDAVRNCLKDGGFAGKKDEVESGGTFLVAYRGKLFSVYSDYQVGEDADGYAAVGCGFAFALGAIHATKGEPAEKRVRKALKAAAKFSAYVMPPFHVLRLKGETNA